ncbi:MAG: tetratricopeptide repeat protein [Bryobacterales bacterium]|nr:tetratricopeptide repeat protein [Bryobacterales bacterium]
MRTAAAALVLLGSSLFAGDPEFERAQRLFNNTDFDGALRVLLAADPKDGPSLLLAGRSYYMNGDFKKSTDYMLKAVAVEPSNSTYYLWLGRAFGRRAETSSFLTAASYATKARENFERAVALNPRNTEALMDLFEYYLQAPGLLGGGLDKARATSQKINQLDPAEYSYAQARLAERQKEFRRAEQQLRRAIDLAPRQAGRVVDLAKFLSNQGRYEEADRAWQQAEQIAPGSPKVMFERASAYVQSKRNLDQAKELLRRYLKAPLTPEDPPRSEAQRLLRQANGG